MGDGQERGILRQEQEVPSHPHQWGSHPLVQNSYDSSSLQLSGSTNSIVGRLGQSIATTYYPDGSSVASTQQFEYDQRGRPIANNLKLSTPPAWNVTTALPTYQQQVSYNDADQPTTTQTTVGGAAGYTFTQVYNSTTGTLTGLSNNSIGTANLATLSYGVNGLVSDLNFLTTSGSNVVTQASSHFTYDGNLRSASTTAIWQSGSGSSGTISSSSRTYDPIGNVGSLITTQATISGQSGSGGSQTENFCYDEENRLVWAGNSGTEPAAGNGTCGNAALANTLAGANYSSSYIYTHLGQLWQGPLGATGTVQQYLYCDSTHPHRLTGVFATGATCSNQGTASYATGYDAWGNQTTRNTAGTNATLSYNVLDQLTQWNAGSSNQEWYAYDASGNRVLRRVTTGTGTTITTYPFGLEEHLYGSTGSNQGNTYYYSLGGRLIGLASGTTTLNTQDELTDALGSVLASFSTTPGSAAVQGNQVYKPYGRQGYAQGVMGTAKGYTGQYVDGTGLDYYGARYYDPVVGQFLSADTVEGNTSGADPYAYVQGNPETFTDPTGMFLTPGTQEVIEDPDLIGQAPGTGTSSSSDPGESPAGGGQSVSPGTTSSVNAPNLGNTVANTGAALAGGTTVHATPLGQGETSVQPTGQNSSTSITQMAGRAVVQSVTQAGGGVTTRPATQVKGAGSIPPMGPGGGAVSAPGDECSFTSDTQVTTDHGKQAIGDLQVGDQVLAYNPTSKKMELQPVEHVWKHSDNDLVDLTITMQPSMQQGKGSKATPQKSEVVHTTSEHPFL